MVHIQGLESGAEMGETVVSEQSFPLMGTHPYPGSS